MFLYSQLKGIRPARLYLGSDMSQDSHHGKWTVSSSDDDDDEALPLSGTAALKPHQLATSAPNPRLGLTAEPAKPRASSGQAATPSPRNPVKHEKSPPLAGKRKKEVSDGSAWALSDSDDEDDKAEEGKSLRNAPQKNPPSPKAKKVKAESERPPSPHGRLYYIDEPEDFFESSVPCLNDTYRFHLNKVTGVDRKYNTGALHIRGEPFRSQAGRLSRTALNPHWTTFYQFIHALFFLRLDVLSPLFGTLKASVQVGLASAGCLWALRSVIIRLRTLYSFLPDLKGKKAVFVLCSLTTASILPGWLSSIPPSSGRWWVLTKLFIDCNCTLSRFVISMVWNVVFFLLYCWNDLDMTWWTDAHALAVVVVVFVSCRDRPVLIVHGDKREAKARLVKQAQGFPHVELCQVTTPVYSLCLILCRTWWEWWEWSS